MWRLRWVEWNVKHIAIHDVMPDEVEDVCLGTPVMRQSYRNRVILIGPTQKARLLTVVLDLEAGDLYYPVSARPASRKERARYHNEKEGGVAA